MAENEQITETFNGSLIPMENIVGLVDALENAGGTSDPCQVPTHEANYNHALLHGNSTDHAPHSDDQDLGDITKEQIEAKLTGEIASHTHAGSGGGTYAVFIMDL
jgi:hypothetical protein